MKQTAIFFFFLFVQTSHVKIFSRGLFAQNWLDYYDIKKIYTHQMHQLIIFIKKKKKCLPFFHVLNEAV